MSTRPPASATTTEDVVTVVLALSLVSSVFADGYTHLNSPGLDTFFTPSHGALYLSALLTLGWIGLAAVRRALPTRSLAAAVPAGYGLGILGAGIFLLAGAGDLVWHEAFGIESGIDALLSPTHLGLYVGGLLALTAPLRGALARSGSGGAPAMLGWPAAVSLATATALTGFFLLYASPYALAGARQPLSTIPEGTPGHLAAEAPTALGVAAYLLVTLLLVVPVLFVVRRFRPPVGFLTLLVVLVAGLTSAAAGDGWAPVAAALGAGVVLDLVGVALGARLHRPVGRLVLAGLVPSVLWSGHLLAVAGTDGVRWPVELWSGVVLLSALLGLVVAVLTEAPVVLAVARDGAAA